MDYQLLSVYKYNGSGPSKSNAEVDAEYQRRLAGYATIVTDMYPVLDKNEYEQIDHYPLFFVQTNAINRLINEITRNSSQITAIAEKLPGVAKRSYTLKLLTSEIYYTNEIEGVKTNKQEIGTVVGQLATKGKDRPIRRLASAVKLYHDTLTGKSYQIESLQDFREIYNKLLKGEISKYQQPDGKIFRDQPVYIGTADQKIHTPPAREAKIQSKLTPLIRFMNQHDIQDLTKAVVTHFMFENSHPFNDGNGRTGRYLLSSYLANKLDHYTGLSISGAIHTDQSAYYKAFKQADNWENRADVTLFIQKIMEIISKGQTDMIINLNQLSDQLEQTLHKIESAFHDPVQCNIMYLLAQSKLFSENSETGIKDIELINVLYASDSKKFHKNKIRSEIENLTNQGVITEIKKRPLQHLVGDEYLRYRF